MKKLCIAFLCFLSAHAAFADVPSLSAITAISITLPNAWRLEIKNDGSGSIGFGSGIADYGRFPSNSFKFEEIYQNLSTHVESGPARASQANVSFLNDLTCSSFNIKDRTYILHLLDLAHGKARFIDKKHFDKLLIEKPFSSE